MNESKKEDQTLHLIANITHQAINPLNGVIGTLDNIIDGTTEEHRQKQRLGSARAQLETTVTLIRNLAYFAQYGAEDAPKIRSSKTTVIPQNLIEAAMYFQEQGKHRGVEIKVTNRHEQNAVKGDPELLRQVFMNIVDNYIKYAMPDTEIQITQWRQLSR